GGVTALGALAAFGCGELATTSALRGARRASGRARSLGSAHMRWLSRRLRDGVGCTMPLARLLMRSPRCAKLAREAVREMRGRGLAASETSLASAFSAAVLLVAVAAGFVTASPAGGVAVAACACAVAVARLRALE